VDVGNVEKVEADLNRFIERRAREAKSGRDRVNDEAAWDRLRTEGRNRSYREAVLRQRLAYHEEQLARHTATFNRLIHKHRVGLHLCRQELGIESKEGDAA
jgi:hypothetical protein